MEKQEDIISSLMTLGLTGYEAKAYLAALSDTPSTGYKLSKMSGVPRSKIYEVIEKLIQKGFLVFQSGDRNLVSPVDINFFLDRKKDETLNHIDFLKVNLPKFRQEEDHKLWNVTGNDQILEMILKLIHDAEKSFFLIIASKDLVLCIDQITKAKKRGIKVGGLFSGQMDEDIEGLYNIQGSCCECCSQISLTVDGKIALIGATYPEEYASAVITEHRGFVEIVEDYIKHELFLNRYFATQEDEVVNEYKRIYSELMKEFE